MSPRKLQGNIKISVSPLIFATKSRKNTPSKNKVLLFHMVTHELLGEIWIKTGFLAAYGSYEELLLNMNLGFG
jgi:hypothetical protein